MAMTDEIGFELVYPENCKELSEDLKPEEFRKRINVTFYESIDEQSQEMDCRPNTASKERLKYAGICIHLLSPQFTHYPDIDIRLRIGVALCRMLTIFCPLNPFEHASNCQSVVGNSTLHQTDPELWTSFLSRFNDIDVNIRSFCIQMVPLLLRNPEIPKSQIFDCLRASAMDRSDAVRLLALKTVASLMREAKDDSIGDFFELVHNRSRDKSLNIRKEALAELASFYKRCLLSGKLDLERMTVALNATLHMYYQPSAEDK
ncbi:unnamed protein product [Dibothriocephalus latus]|uniref:Condensin complex subunit 1 C-terminal domain-containing protein n=1 Tax=Dibothriocephalus latus TaxID=60516 RepID=A0A3P6TQ29_DIBLA|nr:unnamed protein product [Dibothriocephalus latus]